MAAGQFIVSDTNPNNEIGGGGCICDEQQQTDCKGPFIIISNNTMDSGVSPYPVACQRCVNEWAKALEGEALNTGDATTDDTPRSEDSDEAKAIKREHYTALRARTLPSPRVLDANDEEPLL